VSSSLSNYVTACEIQSTPTHLALSH